MVRIVALLGNPGKQYERTRHNSAWLFAEHCGWMRLPWRAKWGAGLSDIKISESPVLLLRPMRFMNRSGESISMALRFYHYDPAQLLVVHDDVELPFGDVQFKVGGGLAGHNGLHSLADRVGSREFLRLRIGIGRPQHGNVASFVLSAFSRADVDKLPDIFDRSQSLLERVVVDTNRRGSID